MSHERLSRCRPLAILALVILPLLGVLSAAAQEAPENDAVAPVNLTLSFEEILAGGASWFDGETLHVRGLTVSFSVEGDLSGTATVATDLDWSGPCDPAAAVCSGPQQGFASVELVTETGTWSGSLALESGPDTAPQAHGILIGHGGAAGQVLVISEVTGTDGASLSVAGSLATLAGPTGGIALNHSACITGENSADGGFLGGQGLIQDSGPARITRQEIGSGEPFGVYGEVTDIGTKGIVRGLFVAELHDRQAHGSFVILGVSGPYRGMVGYGRALMSLSEDARCGSGLLATSSWVGQARFVTDPAGFLAPRVRFVTPVDGGSAPTPVQIRIDADHVEIEPAGSARDGAGYLVIIVDAPCVGPGELVPQDEQHIHLSEGQTETELSLFSGRHRLCAQLVDGAGIAQPATDVIIFDVSSSGGGDDLGR